MVNGSGLMAMMVHDEWLRVTFGSWFMMNG